MAAPRKPFLLRVDPEVLEAMQRWAKGELRSVNAQIEYVLRRALIDSGRIGGGQRARGKRGGGGER